MNTAERLRKLIWHPARDDRATLPRHSTGRDRPLRDDQTGFIQHPSGFPLEFKRIWFGDPDPGADTECHDIGLLFECDRYLRPGTVLDVRIPLRGETQGFRGRVVLVRHNGQCFEIGMWVPGREDAGRMRIVEQICHIESYLRRRKFAEGPYALNREQAAEEWIRRYAAGVPSL